MNLLEAMYEQFEKTAESAQAEIIWMRITARQSLKDANLLDELLEAAGLPAEWDSWESPRELTVGQCDLAQIVLQEAIVQAADEDLDSDIVASLIWWLGPLIDCTRFARLAINALEWAECGDIYVELPSSVKTRFEQEDWQLVADYMVMHFDETDFALLTYFCNLPEAVRKAVPAEFGHYLCALLYMQFMTRVALLLSLMLASLRAPGAKLDPIRMTADARNVLIQKTFWRETRYGGLKSKSAEADDAEADGTEASAAEADDAEVDDAEADNAED